MNRILSVHWIVIAAIWYFINGILHDVFVIRNHKGNYDRELLRLLMDGHVLILSGILLFISYGMMTRQISGANWIALTVGVGMFGYCLMIYPFLKSFATMSLSFVVIVVCLFQLFRFGQ